MRALISSGQRPERKAARCVPLRVLASGRECARLARLEKPCEAHEMNSARDLSPASPSSSRASAPRSASSWLPWPTSTRRRWLELGHSSLFYFLHRELGLSKGAAFYRKTAAELIQRFPEIVEPLRDGRLCLTSVVELAKVLTPENRASAAAVLLWNDSVNYPERALVSAGPGDARDGFSSTVLITLLSAGRLRDRRIIVSVGADSTSSRVGSVPPQNRASGLSSAGRPRASPCSGRGSSSGSWGIAQLRRRAPPPSRSPTRSRGVRARPP